MHRAALIEQVFAGYCCAAEQSDAPCRVRPVGVRADFNNDVEGAAVRDARWLRDPVVADG